MTLMQRGILMLVGTAIFLVICKLAWLSKMPFASIEAGVFAALDAYLGTGMIREARGIK